MRTFLTCALALMLTGCGTIFAKPDWPAAPETLTKECPDLKQVPETEKLSVVVDTVVDNYALYHECQAKVQGWNDWYKQQKNIYEGVK